VQLAGISAQLTRKNRRPKELSPKDQRSIKSLAAGGLAKDEDESADANAGGEIGFMVTRCYGQKRSTAIAFGAEMSHPHYWAEIDSQGAALAGGRRIHRAPGRNAENISSLALIGSRSSILGGPGELNL